MHMARMWVTEGCNAFCHYCFNAQKRQSYKMDVEHFESLCHYFQKCKFDKIAIMGGEPTTHPDFQKLMIISQTYFGIVYLYTNALKVDVLNSFSPRETDSIIYNFNFSSQFDSDRFLLDYPGERILDVVIHTKTDVDYVSNEILRVTGMSIERIRCQLVFDYCANIFKDKRILVDKLNNVYNFVKNANPNIKITFESNLPLCFTFGESLPPFTINTICPEEAVLVDGQYNACFCNVFPNKLINMFRNNEIVPFTILRNYSRTFSTEQRLKGLNKICKDCLLYGVQCNGKCFISQDSITREDIVSNTKLTWFE